MGTDCYRSGEYKGHEQAENNDMPHTTPLEDLPYNKKHPQRQHEHHGAHLQRNLDHEFDPAH